MAELSYYWDGTATGDAAEAPYEPAIYHANWKTLFTKSDDEGYIDDYLNELLPTVAGQQVVVASGAALVNGWYYENTDSISFTIETPSSNPRIDRIVVRLSTIGQIARLTKIVGTEAAVPTAPALTQSATIWDIPVAQAYITTAGVVSGTDEREMCKSPIMPQGAIFKIDEITSDGTLNKFIFEDIPQIYRHLFLEVFLRSAETAGVLRLQVNNGDENAIWQQLVGDNAVITASAADTDSGFNMGSIPSSISTANFYGQIEIYIQDYLSTNNKSIIANNFSPRTDVLGNFEYRTRAGLIPDTNPITKITLFQTDDLDKFAASSFASLYGMT